MNCHGSGSLCLWLSIQSVAGCILLQWWQSASEHTHPCTHTLLCRGEGHSLNLERGGNLLPLLNLKASCFRLNQSDYPQITLFSVVPEESHYPQWWCHAPKNIICRIATLSGLFSHKNLMGLLVSSAPSFLHGTGSISALAGSSCTLQILLFYHLI